MVEHIKYTNIMLGDWTAEEVNVKYKEQYELRDNELCAQNTSCDYEL